MAEKAIARAKQLDEYYQKTGKLIGPLVSFEILSMIQLGLIIPARSPYQRQRTYWHKRPDMQCRLRFMVQFIASKFPKRITNESLV